MTRVQLAMLGLSAGIVAAGCAAPNKVVATTYTPASISSAIQQSGYGFDARFTRCSGARCPARTVKTLADVERAATAPVVARAPVAPQVKETHKLIAVQFGTGSARLSDQDAKVFDAVFTEAMPIRRIVIRGRTDSTGSLRSNDRLAERRAEAVRDYWMKTRSSDTVEITLDSKGRCYYAAENHSASGRAANRRVEVEVFLVTP